MTLPTNIPGNDEVASIESLPPPESLGEFGGEAAPMPTPTATSGMRGKFSVNLFANVVNYLTMIGIGFFYTPYLVHSLGVAVYGLIPLTNVITSYLSIVSLGLNSAVGRDILVNLERRADDEANAVFNTSFFGSLLLALVLLVPGIYVCLHPDIILRIPAGYESQASVLVSCTFAVFIATMVATPFDVSTFVRNRFDLRNGVIILATLTRVGTVILLFSLTTPHLWHVGLGYVLAGGITVIGALIFWRVLTASLHLNLRLVRLRTLRQLTSLGGWAVVNQIGSLLFIAVDLIIVNRLFGPHIGGCYAAVLQWSIVLRGFASAISGVFAPTILGYYARNDIGGMVGYARQAVKLVGLAIALPIGLVCGLSAPLLHLWLGPEFVRYAPLLSLLTLPLCINLSMSPLFTIQLATRNVHVPGIVTFIMGAGNLGLALLFAGPLQWGVYGVAAAGAIMLTAKNTAFTPLYNAHIIRRPPTTFLYELLPIVVSTLAVAAGAWALSRVLAITSWLMLFACCLFFSLLFVIAVYFLALTPAERERVNLMLARVLHRVTS